MEKTNINRKLNKEIISVFLAVLCSLIFCSSCSKIETDTYYLAYQERAFSATVSINYSEPNMSMKAEISLGEWSPKGEERDISMTFIEPSSVSGISVTRICGEVSTSLGEIKYETPAISGFLNFTKLFSIDGEVIEVGSENGINTLKIRCAENEEYTVKLEGKNGVPISIKGNPDGRNISIEIEKFEYR